ncbi:MAG: bifunctional DNA-formamidopyrimidine glycosylase/DNA-(apurinic or apyrimidinic site) lyase [Patescibacteria group bacterium]
MPELPEVETIKNGLRKRVLEKPILSVDVNNASVIKNGKSYFVKTLTGGKFASIGRRGKMLIFEIEKETGGAEKNFLLARLGMTGRLVYFDKARALGGDFDFRNKKNSSCRHCHVVFAFEGGGILLFYDTRRFGYLEIVDEKGLERKLKTFGPEPLDSKFTLKIFQKIIEGKKTNIKALLLNQKYIAGIGNIYADEILFEAKIDPRRSADSLSAEEAKVIYAAIKKILKKAVENRGTTFSDYVDAEGNAGNFKKYLKVYGRSGTDCLECGGKIKKTVVAGRGTSFCEQCQK